MTKDLYDEVNEFIAETEKIRKEYSVTRQKIKDDENLSQRGRIKLLNELFETHTEMHKEVKDRYQKFIERTKERVIKNVYSHPTYSKTGAKHLRPLVEKAESAYSEGDKEVEALTERALNMRDAEQVRALVATSYARRDWATLNKLKEFDDVAFEAIDYETLFGSLGTPELKLKMNIDMRAPTKYE